MIRTLTLLATAALVGCASGVSQTTPPSQTLAQAHAPFQSQSTMRRQSTCPAAPGGTGVLPDGDFSQANDPGNRETGLQKGTNFAPDWTVTRDTIDFEGTGGPWTAPNGMCSVDLDGTPGAGGAKTVAFPTNDGSVYQVSFQFSGNGACPPRYKVMIVAAAGTGQTFTWDTRNHHDAQHGFFQQETWNFTAVGPKTSIAFVSRDPHPETALCGPIIAGVAVAQQ